MRRLLVAAGAMLALLGAAPAAGEQAVANRPEIELYVSFVPDRFLTRYHLVVSNGRFEYRTARVTWKHVPPAAEPACTVFASMAHKRRGYGLRFTADANWLHGDQHGCNHRQEGPRGHRGSVTATVRISGWRCVVSYEGTVNGEAGPNACRAI